MVSKEGGGPLCSLECDPSSRSLSLKVSVQGTNEPLDRERSVPCYPDVMASPGFIAEKKYVAMYYIDTRAVVMSCTVELYSTVVIQVLYKTVEMYYKVVIQVLYCRTVLYCAQCTVMTQVL